MNSKIKTVLFPGSFDPVTKGHYNVVERALNLFDKIIVALGENSQKKCLFSIKKRLALLESSFSELDRVEVISYKGLTASYCLKKNIKFIVRGIRNETDFSIEKTIHSVNKQLNSKLETISLFTKKEYSDISSSVVRDVYLNGGDVTPFLPKKVDISLFK